MLAYLCETLFEMDLYSTLNSLAPLLTGGSTATDHSGDAEGITDFPPTDDPVYILGAKYSSLYELSDIRDDVRSVIWVTYRRNFAPIGDSSMTADSGWGCMLRTGQMVLAQAFSKLHLGRDWRWQYSDTASVQSLLTAAATAADDDTDPRTKTALAKYLKYRTLLKLFLDLKTAPYSIHQIALMGACEGKRVGEWFGPNTVAQVLKKLSVFDKFNDIYIHVALDNMVFIDDIKKHCKSRVRLPTSRQSKAAAAAATTSTVAGASKCNSSSTSTSSTSTSTTTKDTDDSAPFWRPLILFIPLRLGLTDINPVYFRALKSTFAFPQTLGILGGRPNHALYFIGCVGDQLVHLDPHTTQTAVTLAEHPSDHIGHVTQNTTATTTTNTTEGHPSTTATVTNSGPMDDLTYHCERASRMPLHQLDPSIALGFLCRTEEEFDQWATLTLHKLIQEEQQPLFEIMKQRPANWPSFDDDEADDDFADARPPNRNSVRTTADHQKLADHNPCSTSPPSDTSFIPLEDDEEYEIID